VRSAYRVCLGVDAADDDVAAAADGGGEERGHGGVDGAELGEPGQVDVELAVLHRTRGLSTVLARRKPVPALRRSGRTAKLCMACRSVSGLSPSELGSLRDPPNPAAPPAAVATASDRSVVGCDSSLIWASLRTPVRASSDSCAVVAVMR
jgi:hypothetical protein